MAFQWGSGGQKITTPQQAERQRQIAEALISQSSTPATNWAAGLGDVAAAFSGTMLNNQASAAEEAGRLSAAQSLAGIGPSSDFASVSQALANPWLSQPQASVASALLSQNLERSDPSYQLDMAYKQAQLDNLQNPQVASSSLPSNVQEWQYYSGLTPEEQSQYLTMKRSNSPLNIGTGFVTQDPANPGTVMGAPIAIDNVTPAQDAAVGTGLGNQQLTTIDAGRTAASNNAKLDILSGLLETAPQGGQGKIVQIAGGLGVDLGGLNEVQAANALISQLVPLQRAPGSGTMSDADLELYKASLPSIINQPEANQIVIATQRALNDYTIAHANIENRLVQGQIDEATAMAEKAAIPNPLVEFKRFVSGESAPAPTGGTDVDSILKQYGL